MVELVRGGSVINRATLTPCLVSIMYRKTKNRLIMFLLYTACQFGDLKNDNGPPL